MSIHEDWKDEQPYAATPGAPPPPKQMTGCLKALLILLVVGAFGMLLCCGVGGYFVYLIQKGMSSDPVVIRTNTAEITDIQLPGDFQPAGTFRFLSFMKIVAYETPEGGMLMLGEFNQNLIAAGENPEHKFDQAFGAQAHNRRDLDIIRSETRDFEIRGATSKFQFAEAKDPQTGKEFRQVSGGFRGKSGPAVLLLQVPADEYDEETIEELIKSIK